MLLEAAMHLQGEVKAIAELEDRFAVAYQAGSRTSLFCSADGVTQLFYAVQGGALHYGSSVSDVIGSAGLNCPSEPLHISRLCHSLPKCRQIPVQPVGHKRDFKSGS